MRDIINASNESLIKLGSEEHIDRSRASHEMKDSILPTFKVMANGDNNDSCRVLTQAMFESGLLTVNERDFNLTYMLGLIYGAKMHESINAFISLFDKLVAGGYTGYDGNMFNPSGDNYLCALQYQVKPDENNYKVRKIVSDLNKLKNEGGNDFRTDVFRKVIVMKCQSPTYAVVLDYSIYSNKPTKMHLVRLKEEYNDPEMIQDLIGAEFNFDDNKVLMQYSIQGSHTTICKIIATLQIDKMICEHVYYPTIIESILFRMQSSNDSISVETAAMNSL